MTNPPAPPPPPILQQQKQRRQGPIGQQTDKRDSCRARYCHARWTMAEARAFTYSNASSAYIPLCSCRLLRCCRGEAAAKAATTFSGCPAGANSGMGFEWDEMRSCGWWWCSRVGVEELWRCCTNATSADVNFTNARTLSHVFVKIAHEVYCRLHGCQKVHRFPACSNLGNKTGAEATPQGQIPPTCHQIETTHCFRQP